MWREAIIFVASILGGVLAIAIYLIPSYVAVRRKHPKRVFVILLNILTGWTFIGYVVSMIWALYSPLKEEKINNSVS